MTGFLNNFLSYVKTHLSNCEKSGGASSKTIVHGSVLKIWRALARFLSKNVSNGLRAYDEINILNKAWQLSMVGSTILNIQCLITVDRMWCFIQNSPRHLTN